MTTPRERLGKPEDIAIVGPRGSGKTTIARLLGEWHMGEGRIVGFGTETFHYQRRGGDTKPDVVIHDGYIPERPCRVVSTSEIW